MHLSPSGGNVSPPTGPRVQAFVRVKRHCEDDDKMSMIGMQEEDLSPSGGNVSPPTELRVPSSHWLEIASFRESETAV